MAEETDEPTKTAEAGTEEIAPAVKADENGTTPPSQAPAPRDAKAILEAVKERLSFFFSDANVRQDLFLRKYLLVQQRQADDNSDKTKKKAAVPVDVLLRFNTIKQHTDSAAVVVQAAKELDSILTVHDGDGDDKTVLIGRVDPFTEAKMKENIPNTLYLSNLPVEKNRYKHTTDDIRNLFGADKAATIVLVKFQYASNNTAGKQHDGDDDDPLEWNSSSTPNNKKGGRTAVGACLVEFENLAALEAAAAHTLTSKDDGETLQPSHVLKLGEHHIVEVQLFQDYLKSRKQLQKKRKKDDVQDDENPAEKGGNKFHIDWKPGCVIQITGIASGCDRETILSDVAKELDMTREKLLEDKVVYADYSRGQTTGALRFQEPTDAIAKLCDKLNSGETTIAGEKVEKAVVLAGDEEEKYWKDFIEFKNKQQHQRGNERNSKRKKGRRS